MPFVGEGIMTRKILAVLVVFATAVSLPCFGEDAHSFLARGAVTVWSTTPAAWKIIRSPKTAWKRECG